MRSRMIREGSVGLLILLGVGMFTGLILWLRGVNLGARSYKFYVEFSNIAGIQVGTPVRYRGALVGKVTKTQPGTNGVAIEIEISPADLVIPKNVKIEPSQAGVLAGAAVDITPVQQLTAVTTSPLDTNCNAAVIICQNDRLTGQVGASIDELFRASIRVANAYSDPKLLANVNAVMQNGADAAAEIARLSREFGTVAQEFKGVATVAKEQLASVSDSSRAFNQTAAKLGLTADQVNDLLATNRATLVGTLNNINLITADLRSTVNGLAPVVDRVGQGELLKNLETLSANAAQASADFRDLSQSLNNPSNLMTLQQTLDSARATFDNVQKITTDLDELTGDPKFRDNLRNLVNGLSNLVSSTQQLQQQAQLAQTLAPLLPPAPTTANPVPSPASPTPSTAADRPGNPEKL